MAKQSHILLIMTCVVSSSSTPIGMIPWESNGREEYFHSKSVANFLKHRCGPQHDGNGVAVWSYEGSLTDPLTGKLIADVEGLEIAKLLPTIYSSSDVRIQSILDNLSVKNLLFPRESSQSSKNEWDSATTILTRRLFCYRVPSSTIDEQASNLLTSLRIRPGGPLRFLSPSESIAVYDSAVTYITRNNGREMVVFSELGGNDENTINDKIGNRGKTNMMGSVASSVRNHPSFTNFEFSVHAQKKSTDLLGRELRLPPMRLSPRDDVFISPPRSRFFQFGKGESAHENGLQQKYGSVTETYSYSFTNLLQDQSDNQVVERKCDRYVSLLLKRVWSQFRSKTVSTRKSLNGGLVMEQPQCTVKYTRYGEAPPWYAPGRMCTLELRGKRLVNLEPMGFPLHDDEQTEHTNMKQISLNGHHICDFNLESSEEIPPLACWAASKCKPSFWSGWPEFFYRYRDEQSQLIRQYYQLPSDTSIISNEKLEAFQGAVQSFCRGEKISINPFSCPMNEKQNILKLTVNQVFTKAFTVVARISKSFVVSELPRKGSII